MTDNLLEASIPEGAAASEPTAGSDSRASRPAGLPDKFWDERKGQVRLEALIKSYLELERKLSALGSRDIPSGPNEYDIKVNHDFLTADPDVNQRLHGAGFSQGQAQLVYDLASERLMPMIGELAAMFEADRQVERLTQYFGGNERWREIARQIDAWGRSHLPERVFEALSTTYEGIIAMHRMMTGDEPGLLRDGRGSTDAMSEGDLKQLMRDPRYWKQQDPVIVDKVRNGFKRLYQQ